MRFHRVVRGVHLFAMAGREPVRASCAASVSFPWKVVLIAGRASKFDSNARLAASSPRRVQDLGGVGARKGACEAPARHRESIDARCITPKGVRREGSNRRARGGGGAR